MLRPLHYVFRVGNRETIKSFFIDILAMKVLRHEEFEEGCEATCNGPYEGKWSKTMMGYGDEQDDFVLEFTYNYGISQYDISNDLKHIKINSEKVLSNLKRSLYPHYKIGDNPETVSLLSPDGNPFVVVGKDIPGEDPISEVCLAVKDLHKTTDYYTRLLPGHLCSSTAQSSTIKFGNYQIPLVLETTTDRIFKTTASGRIAFSYDKEVGEIEKKMKSAYAKILNSLITLHTPGKVSVDVVILLDPNDHEICVVGNKGYVELSAFDPNSEQLLFSSMAAERRLQCFSTKARKSKSCQ